MTTGFLVTNEDLIAGTTTDMGIVFDHLQAATFAEEQCEKAAEWLIEQGHEDVQRHKLDGGWHYSVSSSGETIYTVTIDEVEVEDEGEE
ncbi:MAG: hypothetical protein QM753_12045 [Thermomicrobiales bacterium]